MPVRLFHAFAQIVALEVGGGAGCHNPVQRLQAKVLAITVVVEWGRV